MGFFALGPTISLIEPRWQQQKTVLFEIRCHLHYLLCSLPVYTICLSHMYFLFEKEFHI